MIGEDPVAAGGLQGHMLQVRVLVGGADSGVSDTAQTDSSWRIKGIFLFC